jgi:uncharacterized membrane protein (UPF0127 family)
MKRLLNRSKQNSELAAELRVAESFLPRLKGLMFDRSMNQNSALWIKQCKSIHTCFMNFSIDSIFIDKNLVVKKIYQNLKPWRMTQIVWYADSVIEFPGGTLRQIQVDIGDELYVGD